MAYLLSLAAASLFVLGSFAMANPIECTPTSFEDVDELNFTERTEEAWIGMSVSFQLGLMPASFPEDEISEVKNPCIWTSFAVASDTFSIFGENSDSPPRWATSETNSAELPFLAILPRPSTAYQWYIASQNDSDVQPTFSGKESRMFALVLTNGTRREITKFYSDMPSPSQLSFDMCHSLGGGLPILMSYDTTTKQAELRGLFKTSVNTPNPNSLCNLD